MLGKLLGEGRTAEVFAYGEGRAVKLMRPGFNPADLLVEADKTRAAFAAGVPGPEVFEVVEIEGRTGVVFARLDGPSMLDDLVAGAEPAASAGPFADLHVRVLTCRTADLPDIREQLADGIDRADGLTDQERRLAKQRLARMAESESVLHGDFHPGNIHLSGSEPLVVDWIDAARGSPAADIARTLLLASPRVIPTDMPDRQRLVALVHEFRAAYWQALRERIGVDESSVAAWALPVAAARLAEGIEHERGPLVAEVRRLLS